MRAWRILLRVGGTWRSVEQRFREFGFRPLACVGATGLREVSHMSMAERLLERDGWRVNDARASCRNDRHCLALLM